MIIQVVLQLVVLVLQLEETDLIIHVGEQQRRHMGEGGQPSLHSHTGLTSSPSTLPHLDGLQVDSELQLLLHLKASCPAALESHGKPSSAS